MLLVWELNTRGGSDHHYKICVMEHPLMTDGLLQSICHRTCMICFYIIYLFTLYIIFCLLFIYMTDWDDVDDVDRQNADCEY